MSSSRTASVEGGSGTGAARPPAALLRTSGRRGAVLAAAALTTAALALAGCAPGERADGPGAAGSTGGGVSAASLADSTVGAWVRAAGGLEAWDRVRTLRYTVTTVWYDSASTIRRMRPRRVGLKKVEDGFMGRLERPEAEGLYVQVYNGDTAWATLNDRPLPAGHAATGESEYVARDVYYWIGLPYKLRDPGVNLEARRTGAGEAPTVADEGGVEVRVTFGGNVGQHPGDRYFYYFLDGDPYPEEVHYIAQGSTARSRTLWRDFREADPLTYVGTRRYVNDRGRPTKELRIDDVVINPPLPDSLFAPPGRR